MGSDCDVILWINWIQSILWLYQLQVRWVICSLKRYLYYRILIYKIVTLDGLNIIPIAMVRWLLMLIGVIWIIYNPWTGWNEFGHQESVLLIDLCLLDPFILRPPVLEPDLYLSFGQLQYRSHLKSSSPGYVLVLQELMFELNRLCSTKRSPLPSWSAFLAFSSCHWNWVA